MSSQLHVSWCHIGSLRLAMVGAFLYHRNQQLLQVRTFISESWLTNTPLGEEKNQ